MSDAEKKEQQSVASTENSGNQNTVADAINDVLDDQSNVGNQGSSEIDQLKNEVAEANNRALRAQAELENMRRRFRRDQEEALRYANKPLLADLLPVLDNIERAIESASAAPDSSGLLEGVKMVANQLHSVLEKHHCPRISAEGEPFDPELHEAIQQQPSDQPKGTVLAVAQHGYKLHDRLIRPAQVVVSTGPDDSSGQEENQAS